MPLMCTCPIRPGMNYDQLLSIAADRKMCTDMSAKTGDPLLGGYMCPTLTKALDRAQAGRAYHERRARQLKSVGYTDAQIAEMPKRTRRRSGTVQDTVPAIEFDF